MAMKAIAGPAVGMVMAECAQVGLMIVSKSVMSKGMSSLIFVFYSNAFAALLLLPVSLLYHRQAQLPRLSASLVSQFFLLGLLGCLAQIFGYAGINYSSPTLGTAMLNLIPGFTFILAVIFSMERLDWRRASTLAKSVGTIVSISGAFVVTFYKGAALMRTPSISFNSHLILSVPSNWVIGGLLLAADCVMASAFIILQAAVLKKYPAEFIVVFFYCFFVAIQSAIISLFVVEDSSAWILNSRMRLISSLYSAIFGSAFQVGVSTWCLHRTGPVFVSMFKPLGIAIAVAIGVIFFKDTFYLGSLLGSCIIVIGFYSVMWGKAKEEKVAVDPPVGVVQPNSRKVPLLETIIEEI